MTDDAKHIREARAILERNAGAIVDEWMSASALAGHSDLVFIVIVSPDSDGSIESWDRDSPVMPFHAARALGVAPEDGRVLALFERLPDGMIWVCLRSGPIAEVFGVDVAKLEIQRVQRQIVATRRVVH
jgi:hypothetical protein